MALLSFYLLSVTPLATALKLWQQPADLPSAIPVSCRAGLSTNITCGPSFVSAANVLAGLSYGDDFLGQYCTSSCLSSLKTFRSTVGTRCRGQVYPFAPGVNQTGEAVADALLWAYNVTCLKDSSAFCAPQIFNGTAEPCSNCLLGYQQAALQVPAYGNRIVDREAFASTLSSCHAPSGSFTVPPTTTSTKASTNPTSTPFCSGSTYTAQSGDTCKSVAQANSVGQDIFITQNRLAYNCDTIPAGTELCIGDSCELHEVGANETCKDITASLDRVSTFELSNWNPTIHSNCDNLSAMQGRLICVSPPGGKWTPDDNSIPGVNNGDSTSTATFTPFLQTTNMVPVQATPSPPTNFTSGTYGIPQPTTRTREWNATAVSALKERQSYCPDFTNTTINDIVELPDDCQDLWDPYCYASPDDPILPSPTSVPSSCEPSAYATDLDDSSDSVTADSVTSSGTSTVTAGGVVRIAGQTSVSSTTGFSQTVSETTASATALSSDAATSLSTASDSATKTSGSSVTSNTAGT